MTSDPLMKAGPESSPDQRTDIKADASRADEAVAGKLRIDAATRQAAEEWERTEFGLRNPLQCFRTLTEITREGIVVTDPDETILFANRAFADLLGYEQSALAGCNLETFSENEESSKFEKGARDRRKARQSNYETRLRTKGGGLRHIMVSTSPLHDEKGAFTGTLGSFTSIAECNEVEEDLRNSEQRLRVLFESAPDAYYLNDLKGNFLDANRAAEQLVGYDKEELLGKTFLDRSVKLLSLREVPKAAAQLAKNILGKPSGPDEFLLNTKDGAKVPVEIRTFPVTIEGRRVVLGIARDITQRKRAEEKLRESEKLQAKAERMAATGRMAAEVAHEINNPLAGIKNGFRLIKDAVPESHPDYDMVGRIEREIDRIAHIVRQMYKLHSPRAQTPIEVPVAETTRDVVVMLEPLCRDRELTIELASIAPDLIVRTPEGGLQQILYNLLANAIHASSPNGVVHIAAEPVEKGQVRICVRDSGAGILEEVQRRMFEPFFSADAGGRTKEGIGLGLSVVRSIVESLKGEIEFESRLGQGTCFRVYLPSKQP